MDINTLLKKINVDWEVIEIPYVRRRYEVEVNDPRPPTERQMKFLEDLLKDAKNRISDFLQRKEKELRKADPQQLERIREIQKLIEEIEKHKSEFNRSTISWAIEFIKETRWIR